MERAELEQIIEQARIDRSSVLNLRDLQLTNLPESIGSLVHLTELDLSNNNLTYLPDNIGNMLSLSKLLLENNWLSTLPHSIGKLTNLKYLRVSINQLSSLPDSMCNLSDLNTLEVEDNQLVILPNRIGNLKNLKYLSLSNNQLDKLPSSISILSSLIGLDIDDNPFTDLSILQSIVNLKSTFFLDVSLPRKYWTNLSSWKSEYVLEEQNAEVRRILISQLGYEKIYSDLGALPLDIWREYTLLQLDRFEQIDREPMLLLKMTCPSTGHIHILRVPPEMTSAEAAITWVNHGIHPDEFAVQT